MTTYAYMVEFARPVEEVFALLPLAARLTLEELETNTLRLKHLPVENRA